jgi:hypothetical protein
VFLWTVPVALLGFVVSLFLKQVRLRDSARIGSTDMGEGNASPTGADSQCLLESAVGRLGRFLSAPGPVLPPVDMLSACALC